MVLFGISLNPLSAGRSFQTDASNPLHSKLIGLNPLSAGRSFQTKGMTQYTRVFNSLNPLSAGRSFQTITYGGIKAYNYVLIPYQQGGLFRHKPRRQKRMLNKS